MVVSCPHCQTSYNLPDSKIKPNAKLRCTVCQNVFKLDQKIEIDDDILEENKENNHSLELDGFGGKEKKKRKNPFTFILLFILFLAVLISGFWFFTSYLDPVKNYINTYFISDTPSQNVSSDSSISTDNMAERVRLIELRNVRQYNVNNNKIGKIAVIEGKAINGSDTPRELIKVEVTLYDKNNTPITSKTQLAGTSISLFQLEVLGEQEIEQALTNKLDIVANNSNVSPQGIVPFMVVFYNPPEEAMEFGVKVVDAKAIQ